jgi:hypothetical protein
VSRTVASAGRSVGSGGGELVTIVLRLGSPYASLASRRGGFSASVLAIFTASGHPALRQSIQVTFRRVVKAKARKVSRPATRRSSHR